MVLSAVGVLIFPIAVAAASDLGTSVLPFAIISSLWRW
jgi:hypothetical protein